MQKKLQVFTIITCMILSLILSFTLIACDKKVPDKNTTKPNINEKDDEEITPSEAVAVPLTREEVILTIDSITFPLNAVYINFYNYNDSEENQHLTYHSKTSNGNTEVVCLINNNVIANIYNASRSSFIEALDISDSKSITLLNKKDLAIKNSELNYELKNWINFSSDSYRYYEYNCKKEDFLLTDLAKHEVSGTKEKDGSYSIKLINTDIHSIKGFKVPIINEITLKLNNNKNLLYYREVAKIVEDYIPNGIKSTTVINKKMEITYNNETLPNVDLTNLTETEADTCLYNLAIESNVENTCLSDGSKSISIQAGSTKTLDTPKAPNLTNNDFVGWFYDNEYSIPVEDNVLEVSKYYNSRHIYALWKPRSTATLELNGGSLDYYKFDFNNIIYEYNLNGLVPIKEGCDFDEWYLDPNFDKKVNTSSFNPTVIESNKKYYAKWNEAKIPIYVTIKPNIELGYKSIPQKIALNKINMFGAYIPTFNKDGYTCESTGVYPKGNIVLYKDKACTIKFDSNNEKLTEATILYVNLIKNP